MCVGLGDKYSVQVLGKEERKGSVSPVKEVAMCLKKLKKKIMPISCGRMPFLLNRGPMGAFASCCDFLPPRDLPICYSDLLLLRHMQEAGNFFSPTPIVPGHENSSVCTRRRRHSIASETKFRFVRLWDEDEFQKRRLSFSAQSKFIVSLARPPLSSLLQGKLGRFLL